MDDLTRFSLAWAGLLALFALLRCGRPIRDRLAVRLLVVAIALLFSDD